MFCKGGDFIKIVCAKCGKIHDKGYCAFPKATTEQKRQSDADKFRNRQIWKRKVAAIKNRDYQMCRVCLDSGKITYDDLSVHHITPVTADYSKRLDDDNLITLCRYHHELAERRIIKPEQLRRLAATSPLPSLEGFSESLTSDRHLFS